MLQPLKVQQSDNLGNPELKNQQQVELEAIEEEIQESEYALKELTEQLSVAEARIMRHLAENLNRAQINTKANAGMDLLILWAASDNAALRDDYYNYIYLKKKESLHSKILESKGRRLSGAQTKVRLNDWRTK